MITPRTLSPESVDRRLKAAGHERQDGRHRMLRPSTGYHVDWCGQGEVDVSWSSWTGLEGKAAYDHDYEALTPLAATLTRQGYQVKRGDAALPADKYSEEFRWPCLIVTLKED